MSQFDSDINRVLGDLTEDLKSGKLAIFCGAGISRNSGLPIVNEIVPFILGKLDFHDEITKELLERIPFEAFIETLKENSRLDHLFDIYSYGDPNVAHFFIAKLIKTGNLKLVVTTNFDCLIEKALLVQESMLPGRDYDIFYTEKDFDNINWAEDKPRLIKIHGSVNNRDSMAITIKQIASQQLLKSRMTIINQVFSNGPHNAVLILGYSCSDIFDLSPQINAIETNHKKIYIIQHSENGDKEHSKIENIQIQDSKNPFKRYPVGLRIFFNTSHLINNLWHSLFVDLPPLRENADTIDWQIKVTSWYEQALKEQSPAIKYSLPASLHFQISSYNEAIEFYEKALALSIKLNDTIGVGLWYGGLGMVYTELAFYDKAIECLDKSMQIAKTFNDKNAEETCLGNLGNIHVQLANYLEAIRYHSRALKIAEEINDIHGAGIWLRGIGASYQYLAQYGKALYCQLRALKYFKDVGAKQDEGLSIGNIGNVHRSQGKYDEAYRFFNMALEIAKEIGDKKSEGFWLNHCGNIYNEVGDPDKALHYYTKALNIAIQISDEKGRGSYLGNIGNVYSELGEFEKALDYFNKALAIEIAIKDIKEAGQTYGNIGNVYNNSRRPDQAIPYYEKAITIASDIGDEQNEALWIGNMGNANNAMKLYDKAIANYLKAIPIATRIGDTFNEGNLHMNLGLAYCNCGNFPESISNIEKAIAILKQIFDENHPHIIQLVETLRTIRSFLK